MNKTEYSSGDSIVVYNKWKGVFKSYHTPTVAICTYEKHGNQILGFVDISRIKKVTDKVGKS